MSILATKQPSYSRFEWHSNRDKIHGYDDGEAEKTKPRVEEDGWKCEEPKPATLEELNYQAEHNIF